MLEVVLNGERSGMYPPNIFLCGYGWMDCFFIMKILVGGEFGNLRKIHLERCQ